MQSSFSAKAIETVNLLLGSSGTFDYTRCVRPDGTAYGTSGSCRKGTQQNKAEIRKLKAKIKEAEGVIEYQLKAGDPAYASLWAKRLEEHKRKLTELEGNEPVKPTTKSNAPVLTGVEKSALVNYMTGGSMETGNLLDINWRLRGLGEGLISSTENEQIKNLDSALKKLPGNSSGQEFYRGVSLEPKQARNLLTSLKSQGSWKDPGFSSYSRDREQAEEFAGQGEVSVIFITRSKNLRDAGKYAPEEFSDQQESILPRNTPLRVTNIKKDGEQIVVHLAD